MIEFSRVSCAFRVSRDSTSPGSFAQIYIVNLFYINYNTHTNLMLAFSPKRTRNIHTDQCDITENYRRYEMYSFRRSVQ